MKAPMSVSAVEATRAAALRLQGADCGWARLPEQLRLLHGRRVGRRKEKGRPGHPLS